MDFERITPGDRQAVEQKLFVNNYGICECSFVDLYIWSHKYDTSICIDDYFLYVRASFDGCLYYLMPMGEGDVGEAVKMMRQDAQRHNQDLVIRSVTEQMKEKLENALPNYFDFTEMQGSADYIYLASDLINLTGKKYHGKRNHINKFLKEFNGRWHTAVINSDNVENIYKFQQKWRRAQNRSCDQELIWENTSITMLLKDFEQLGCFGTALYVDDVVVAFSIGNRISRDMIVVQIEKADVDIAGSYQMINMQFAKTFGGEVAYINREEDLGIEGLRKAKLSYYPTEIRKKYMAVIK